MRITGGEYSGRILDAPKGRDVRPASDKVRQAVFNALASRIDLENAVVLDGFCGTGSYGLEALSRGAKFCTFIDKDRRSIDVCKQNIEALGVKTQSQVLQRDVLKVQDLQGDPATLLFLDPPYRKDLLLPALEHLKQAGYLADECFCVLECEKELHVDGGESRIYGDVQIIFQQYKCNKG